MNKAIPIIRDFSIAVAISLFTTDKFALSGIAYKSLIFLLIVALIFFALTRINKYSKHLEIVSVLYCENFIRKVLKSLDDKKEALQGQKEIKLFIILPENADEYRSLESRLRNLERIELPAPGSNRQIPTMGKTVGHDQVLLFDTPKVWSMGLDFLAKSKKLSKRKLTSIIQNMNEDIRKYSKKEFSESPSYKNLTFIGLKEFEMFFA